MPHKEKYLQQVNDMVDQLDIKGEKEEIYRKYREVFASLLYTDDAIKNFIQAYKKRLEYKNTIFVITGDHRLIPIPHSSKMVPSPRERFGRRGIRVHYFISFSFISWLWRYISTKTQIIG